MSPKNYPIFSVFSFILFFNVFIQAESSDSEGPGEPLYLTPLIENGNIEDARKKATVSHPELVDMDIESYSGFLTVNKEYGSNLFFWFFLAQNNPENAPLVLWLQGGPGSTSMVGVLIEHGPFIITNNKTLTPRKYSWNIMHNMLYIDSPVGTGFSFTNHEKGYAKSASETAKDIHQVLLQFFQLFPEYQKNPFFITGESYAGKYVPELSHAIKNWNLEQEAKINLQGLAMGNAFSDPPNQMTYGDDLYHVGLLDSHGRDEFNEYARKTRKLLEEENFEEAGKTYDVMVMADVEDRTLLRNLSGFKNVYSFLDPEDSSGKTNEKLDWLNQLDVRKALHVGNAEFEHMNLTVFLRLRADRMKSVAHLVSESLDNYRVLIYSGQVDIVVSFLGTENYLEKLEWSGAEMYRKSRRKIWKVDGELAGYSKTAGNLTLVLVRNAGHMVPMDQPKWAWELANRFVKGDEF